MSDAESDRENETHVDDRSDTGATDAAEGSRTEGATDPERLKADLAVLREENDRLRSAYAAATQAHHRQTALGFAVLGVLAIGGAVVLPTAREVLLALGGTGLFAALLVVYLSPERFVAATVGRDIYRVMADNEDDLVTELGLTDDRVYVPLGADEHVRLFVPQHVDYEIPPEADLREDLLVVPDDEAARGVSLRPTGATLVDEFERSAPGDLADRPAPLAEGLGEALVEQFELIDTVSIDTEPGRVTMAGSESAFGETTGFDHPVSSVLAAGLARGLSVPVECSVRSSDDARADWQVTCRWDPDERE